MRPRRDSLDMMSTWKGGERFSAFMSGNTERTDPLFLETCSPMLNTSEQRV